MRMGKDELRAVVECKLRPLQGIGGLEMEGPGVEAAGCGRIK